MDVILKVLEGAKTGTKIAVKKEQFLIGRSEECHLCAGSSSVSRRHCVILRRDAQVAIKDLGSRNGTYVNGKKISGSVELRSGDELGIGSLKMLLTITHGINNLKRPKVKTVADAVQRTATAGDPSVDEEDITQWLLEAPGPSAAIPPGQGMQSANETQTIRMDDTNAIAIRKELQRQESENPNADSSNTDKNNADKNETSNAASKEAAAGENSATQKEASTEEKKTGKLPPIPKKPCSKDSSEAATQALRNWNRRR